MAAGWPTSHPVPGCCWQCGAGPPGRTYLGCSCLSSRWVWVGCLWMLIGTRWSLCPCIVGGLAVWGVLGLGFVGVIFIGIRFVCGGFLATIRVFL